MIDLFAHDELSALGLAAILDVEKIPYRRITTLDEAHAALLVVAAHELSAAEIAAVERAPALVLAGGERFVRRVFGARTARVVDGACTVELAQTLWPAAVTDLAETFGKTTLRIPFAPVCVTELAAGTSLATLSTSAPAVARRNRCVWSAIDLGAAFAHLLLETATPAMHRRASSHRHGATAARSLVRGVVETAYYAAPDALRRRVQTRAYARLERRLDDATTASEYPIDATGWLVIEMVKRLLVLAAGELVRVARWPAPYNAAATLTHDVEPRRFAYDEGLDRLLDVIATSGHPATLGLVADASTRHLKDGTVERLRRHHVMCHGLQHRGENVDGRDRVAADLREARSRLERRLGRTVDGYRSPRLDRSSALAWALDHTGFRYDSSYPDVDRENLTHFGGGVRVNVPYRPLIRDEAGSLRPSRCLELPLTAPDCIQPLFGGASVETLRRDVARKAAFLRASGGLYVALVHGGVFGREDAALRSGHLAFVSETLRDPRVWLAGIGEIAAWWQRRESLRVTERDGAIQLVNQGAEPLADVRVVVERRDREDVLKAPPLAPGAACELSFPEGAALPAA